MKIYIYDKEKDLFIDNKHLEYDIDKIEGLDESALIYVNTLIRRIHRINSVVPITKIKIMIENSEEYGKYNVYIKTDDFLLSQKKKENLYYKFLQTQTKPNRSITKKLGQKLAELRWDEKMSINCTFVCSS